MMGSLSQVHALRDARRDELRLHPHGLTPRAFVTRSVVLRHGLKNALLSVVTIITLDIAGLLGGALVTENVFRYPGMGQMLVAAVQARDYHIVQAVVMLAAVVYVLLNLFADILYAYLDPRIRYD